MSIEHVLAVVAVTDVERSQWWYESLLGGAADNNPMPDLVEWQVVRWMAAGVRRRRSTCWLDIGELRCEDLEEP
ncbi:MAG TPA: hypothetical protein VFW69_18355 [Mycobacterium sp.]|nr:hypothetical protein [Mycobacterium sp.]